MDRSQEFSTSSGDSGRLNSRTHRAAAGADAETVWNGGPAAGASVRAVSENGHAADTDGVRISKSRVTGVCLPGCVEPRQGRSARRRDCAPGPSPTARASRGVSLARTAGPGTDRLCRVDAERGTQSVGGFARSVRAGVAVTALALLAVTMSGCWLWRSREPRGRRRRRPASAIARRKCVINWLICRPYPNAAR